MKKVTAVKCKGLGVLLLAAGGSAAAAAAAKTDVGIDEFSKDCFTTVFAREPPSTGLTRFCCGKQQLERPRAGDLREETLPTLRAFLYLQNKA